MGRACDMLEDSPADRWRRRFTASYRAKRLRKFKGYRGRSKPRSASATDDKDVCGGAEQTRLLLYSPDGLQKPRSPRRVFEPMVEVGQDPDRTLYPHERFDLEGCLDHFVAHLFEEVEVGGREPLRSSGRVAVLHFADVALYD